MGKVLIIKGADFSVNGINHIDLDDSACTIFGEGIVYYTGLAVANDTFKRSDFIDIKGFEIIRLTYPKSTATFGIAFYSQANEDSYISGIKYDFQSDESYIIPTNASYARFCSSGEINLSFEE